MELWLDRAARERPDAAAVNGISYGDLSDEVERWASALAAAGVGRGDRVATTLAGVDFALLMHAVAALGAVLVPVNRKLVTAEREALLASAGPALVLDSAPQTHSIHLTREYRGPGGSSEVFAVVHTSGTTGQPKPVELTYGNFEASARASAAVLGVEDDDRWLCCMPLFHVGGLSILTRSAINMTEAVVHDGFDVQRVLHALEEERITLVSLVATQLKRLLDAGLEAPPDLRAALVGGGPVPDELIERAEHLGVPVVPTYGMTETCSQIWTGRPLPGAEISNGPGGELLVRGPMVAPGALSDDGWLHTGDRGRIADDGTLHVDGRIADTIISGGENVSATEVENALLAHPQVDDAAVVGRPDPEWGQAVVAYVVGSADPADLEKHLRGRLTGYKIPKAIRPIGQIPRNSAGKILRGQLP